MEQFYKELEKLQPRRADIQKARGELKNVIKTFSDTIENTDIKVKSQSFDDFMLKFQKAVKDNVSTWMDYFGEAEKNEAFQSDLKNSFIVIIYGKVKAGKSTLGNFVARNKLPSQTISFEFYDKDGNKKVSNSLEQFKTDILECTASIQLFKLGAMAWVDTPGLSSMTEENGELAKKYIDNADFVIFPTSSDSPLQQDEIGQIKELVKRLNKKFSVFITKSDMQEEDEINGKIVKILKNKDKERRREQNEDVRKRLTKEINIDENMLGEIISFSVITAEKGKEDNDSNLYQESNIEKFYDLLTQSVLSKAEKLKNEAPLAGLVGLISTISDGKLKELKTEFNSMESGAKKIIEDVSRLKNKLRGEFNIAISDIIDKNANVLDVNNHRQIFKSMKEEIDKKIMSITEEKIREILSEFDKNTLSILNIDDSEFSVKNKYVAGATKKKRSILGTGIGGLIGAGVGFVVAGPIGAGVGATVGAGVGDKISSSTETNQLLVGDNKAEVLNSFRTKNINYYTTDYISEIENSMNVNLAQPITQILDCYRKQIQDFDLALQQLKTKYSQGE